MVMNILTEGKRFSTCTRFSTCKAPRSKLSLVVDLAVLHLTSKGEGVSCPSTDIQDDELSMLAERPGYASDIPAPQLVSFLVFLKSS